MQITSKTTVRKELKLNSADLQNQTRESELGCGRSVARDAKDRDGSYHGAHQGTQRGGDDVAATASRGREQLAATAVSAAAAADAAAAAASFTERRPSGCCCGLWAVAAMMWAGLL